MWSYPYGGWLLVVDQQSGFPISHESLLQKWEHPNSCSLTRIIWYSISEVSYQAEKPTRSKHSDGDCQMEFSQHEILILKKYWNRMMSLWQHEAKYNSQGWTRRDWTVLIIPTSGARIFLGLLEWWLRWFYGFNLLIRFRVSELHKDRPKGQRDQWW